MLVGFDGVNPEPQAATSPDLITWQLEDLGFGNTDFPSGVGFFAGVFIAWSLNGLISVRDPAGTWNLATNPIGAIVAMAASSSRITAMDGTAKIAYSDDAGASFTQGVGPGGGSVTAAGIAYGASVFSGAVSQNIGGEEDAVFVISSNDGITFTRGTQLLSTGTANIGAAFGNALFLLVTGTGTWTSPDGVTYTAATNVPGTAGANTGVLMLFDGDNFVVVYRDGGEPGFAVSADAIAWATSTSSYFFPPMTAFASDGTTLYLAADINGPPDVGSSPSSTWVNTAINQPLSGSTSAEVTGAAFGS